MFLVLLLVPVFVLVLLIALALAQLLVLVLFLVLARVWCYPYCSTGSSTTVVHLLLLVLLLLPLSKPSAPCIRAGRGRAVVSARAVRARARARRRMQCARSSAVVAIAEVLAVEDGLRQRCAPLLRPTLLGLLRCDEFSKVIFLFWACVVTPIALMSAPMPAPTSLDFATAGPAFSGVPPVAPQAYRQTRLKGDDMRLQLPGVR